MKNKWIAIFLTLGLSAALICGCGSTNTKEDTEKQETVQNQQPEDKGNPTEEDKESVNTPDVSKEDIKDSAASKEGDEKNDETSTESKEPANDTAQDVEQGLIAYADTLKKSQIENLTLSYEEKTTGDGEDDYSYYCIKGLNEVDDTLNGSILTEIDDFDQDGKVELLDFELKSNPECGMDLLMKMYEYKNAEVVESGSEDLIDNIFAGEDSNDIRFFLKDDKYICVDATQDYYVCADGVELSLDAYAYDGKAFTEIINFQVGGSDFYEHGKECTELCDQLYTIGMDKTASGVYDNDQFAFVAAEKGLVPLGKLYLENHLILDDNANWIIKDGATCHFTKAGSLEEEFILPKSSEEILTEKDLEGLSKDQLRLARNEIYARYGWVFKDKDLSAYFKKKCWYAPSFYYEDTMLSEVEKDNLKLIQSKE